LYDSIKIEMKKKQFRFDSPVNQSMSTNQFKFLAATLVKSTLYYIFKRQRNFDISLALSHSSSLYLASLNYTFNLKCYMSLNLLNAAISND